MSMDVLTAIAAKLGSIRLPRKNILPLCGKSMPACAVEAAAARGCGAAVRMHVPTLRDTCSTP